MLFAIHAKSQNIFASPANGPKIISVGKIVRSGQTLAEFYYIDYKTNSNRPNGLKSDTTYVLSITSIDNVNKQFLRTFALNEMDNNADKLFNEMKAVFSSGNRDNNDYNKTFTCVNGSKLKVRPIKKGGKYYCELTSDNFEFKLTENELNVLFYKPD